MKITKPNYKINRVAPGTYNVHAFGNCITIVKRGKFWKPVGRSFRYHPTLRDAIMAVVFS